MVDQEVAEATKGNSSFSEEVPGLQLAVDSHSLGEAKTCARKYFLGTVLGWQPNEQSVHLTFGLLMHASRERYDHAKAAGEEHDEALDKAVDYALKATWNKELNRPWSSGHRTKNRFTLLLALVWWLDQFREDPLVTVLKADGKPMVELSFRFDSSFRTKQGHPVLFCGHIDRVAKLNEDPYVIDLKTTERLLTPKWFQQFTPHNQFSMYSLAGRVAMQVPVKGVIVDGLQIGVDFAKSERKHIVRDTSTLEEWHRDAGYWVSQMEQWALSGDWPMNDKSCDMWGGCPFREVCSRSPGARHGWLKANFKQRQWDPLQKRGDI